MPPSQPTTISANQPSTASTGRVVAWWRQLPQGRQDRMATLGPVLAIVLFLVAMVLAFVYLRVEELGRERAALEQDADFAHQRLTVRLLEQQEQLLGLTMSYGGGLMSDDEFLAQSQAVVNRYPEIYAISWLDAQEQFTLGHHTTSLVNSLLYSNGAALQVSPPDAESLAQAQRLHQPVYSRPIIQASLPINEQVQEQTASVQLQIPAGNPGEPQGLLLVEYSIDGLLRYGLPEEIRAKHSVALFSDKGEFFAGAVPNAEGEPLEYFPWMRRKLMAQELEVGLIGPGLHLRAESMSSRQATLSHMLLWLVAALSLLTAYMLVANWRHLRYRAKAQQILQQEIAFRRAMENSMPIGMRALDMEGKVTYVNPAFCKITGWSEQELLGQKPPYPYWPEGMSEDGVSRLPAVFDDFGAAEVQYRLRRRSGELFDARIHRLPLRNELGEQTGWMTSLTDVTEAAKIRRQLSAAHDRFTAVLEAFVGAVSVVILADQQLVFANKKYRQWFGGTAKGHLLLERAQVQFRRSRFGSSIQSHGDGERQEFEYFIEGQQRWLGVRTRGMTWTDGRPAQLLIANDITARKQAEAVAQAHTERAMASSHLITMGEMASSMAHELNQPLTAITNYCNGMMGRIRNQSVGLDDLLAPLEKTAKQAERAGQIIQRIRAFVKRSAPNRDWAHPADLVHEAYELFEIELRRRKVQYEAQIPTHLPQLPLDPILIEQVIVNLVKNAAEALETAGVPEGQRRIVLQVQELAAEEMLEFSVQDNGQGLSPEVAQHLFDAFYSTKKEGMGIGLNLCRSIIEAHGGELQARNIYNETGEHIEGCRFSFTLPLQSSLRSGNTTLPDQLS